MSDKVSRWALAPVVLSGAAALGFQMLWTRRLMDVVGANVESSARVFGCSFLGFALGSTVAALLLARITRPWRAVAWVELGVVVLSLPALLLPFWSSPIWPALGPERLAAWQGTGIKLALSVLAVLPPAFLMGMTLPLATAAGCASGKGLSREGIWIYAAYTVGGGIGLALVAGAALPWWGVAGSMMLLAGLNLLGALLFLKLDYGWPGYSPQSAADIANPAAGRNLTPRLALVLSFCSGAGVMAIEVLGLRLLNLKAPIALYPQAAVLFCAVCFLAVSAAVVPWVVRRISDSRPILICALAGAGLATAASPLLFMAATANRSGLLGYGGTVAGFLATLGGATFLTLGPAIILAGLVFPLLIASAQPSDARSAGRALGGLLAINGVGGVLGAEFSYRFLLTNVDVHLGLGVVGAGYALLSAGVWTLSSKRALLPLGVAVASMVAVFALLGTKLKNLPVFLRSSTFNVLRLYSGREGSLAVVERADLGRAIFLDNHYMLGCTRAAPDMERQAHLPLLLHPAPKQVCFIGLGTGITASGALKHEAVESITIYELSNPVAEAAARHFSTYNDGISFNSRVALRVQDAGPQLSASRDLYDVIIGDLFTPWRPGEARLCSLEQFLAVRQTLRPGGVFCQWLPMTQLTPEHFDIIASTFQRAFGEVHVFRNHFRDKGLPLALVGVKDGGLDWQTVARRCDAEREAGNLRDPVCRHPEGLALLYLGTYAKTGTPGPGLNTLENLRVELAASRYLLTGERGDYFATASDHWLAFVQRQIESVRRDARVPPSLRTLPELGRLIANWDRAAGHGEPEAKALEQELLNTLPSSILTDSEADWSLWPARSLDPEERLAALNHDQSDRTEGNKENEPQEREQTRLR